MSAPAVKRWGRRFLFLWVGMWLSTALLPCREALAAVALDELALREACGHPADKVPLPAGKGKTGACVGAPVPVRVSAARVQAPSVAKSVDHPAAESARPRIQASAPVLTQRRQRLPEAPPPLPFHSRSSRLLL